MFGFPGSIPENEDCCLSLLGLHGSWIQCQTSPSPLYHRSNCGLSANHYILVNLSLGQVTVRRLKSWIPERGRKKRRHLSICTPAFIKCFHYSQTSGQWWTAAWAEGLWCSASFHLTTTAAKRVWLWETWINSIFGHPTLIKRVLWNLFLRSSSSLIFMPYIWMDYTSDRK